MPRSFSRRGMILLIVMGCLVFTMIVFASMVSRVSQESRLTARNSVNEDLYQLASAIGRLSIRRLGKIIENNDRKSNPDIYDAVFNGTPLKDKDFPDIMTTDVIKSTTPPGLKVRYKDLNAVVKYSLEFDTTSGSGFPVDIPGLEQPPYERQGSIVVEVTVSSLWNNHRYTKVCKMSKRFFTVLLLPAPFHKFTLFSPFGANMNQSTANNLTDVGEDGKLGSGDANPPLVLLNCLTQNTGTKLDFGLSGTSSFCDEQTPIKNGWIYLGYTGKSRTSNDHLVLSVLTGDKGSFDPGSFRQSSFGEAFHFYYEPPPKSSGWRGSDEWITWIKGAPSLSGKVDGAGNPIMQVTFVDYGHFSSMYADKPKLLTFNGRALFQGIIDSYENKFPGEGFKRGSRLHLYGVPGKCTPTLVFGQVMRRYMRTFAFHFPEFQRVYPIRGMNGTEYSSFFTTELEPWLNAKTCPQTQQYLPDIDTCINTDIGWQAYFYGVPPRSRLAPGFQEDLYNKGLCNLRYPLEPGKTFAQCFPVIAQTYGDLSELGKREYAFRSGGQLHYTGPITKLSPGESYFKAKTSYYITDNPPNLSDCKFLFDKKILVPPKSSGNTSVFLNQVIRFKNPLTIDKPLSVEKGGIIICDGPIKINQPIINAFLQPNPTGNHPDAFGYLTLISKAGEIEIGNWAKQGTQIYPELHAFLLAMNPAGNGKIKTSGPIHIKGGVAVDRLDQPQNDNLLEKGGIIEWGFEPEEIADGADFKQKNFYGLAMGPRDIEIVQEE